MMVWALMTSSGNYPLEPGNVCFEVREGDALYFRNLRISNYRIKEDTASGFEILVHKDFESESALIFKIVRNWRQDEAYIFPELSTSDQALLVFADGTEYALNLADAELSWQIAAKVYNALKDEELVQMKQAGSVYPALMSDSERKACKQTLKDYFKLVHQLP